VVECVLAKDEIRVRFPVAAPKQKDPYEGLFVLNRMSIRQGKRHIVIKHWHNSFIDKTVDKHVCKRDNGRLLECLCDCLIIKCLYI
jgi:hypothetical protein